MKFCIITFGCKVNQYDSEAVSELLIKAGYDKVDNIFGADIVIFNSCAVTSESLRKLKKSLNFVKKNNINAILVIMGCVPQAFPKVENDFKDVDILIGNSNKNRLVDILQNFIKAHQKIISINSERADFSNFSISRFSERTRAFLKIEDGCNRFCSYCIIPYARGEITSKPIDEILCEVKKLGKNGYKEVTFVGINLSSFGIDIGLKLCDVVKAVSSVSDIKRIRLGSLEPDLVNEELLVNLSKNPKFCPQFHLALQSGSNRILKSMRRRYTREDYLDIVNKINRLFKNPTITTDLIVGFPGETEEDFKDSIKMIKKVGFLKAHVFPYSVRSGTLAADMPYQIPKDLKILRVKQAIAESQKQTKNVLTGFLGKCFPVLYESSQNDIYYEGYTPNYILVKVKSDKDIRGEIIDTYIDSCEDGYCIGHLS